MTGEKGFECNLFASLKRTSECESRTLDGEAGPHVNDLYISCALLCLYLFYNTSGFRVSLITQFHQF